MKENVIGKEKDYSLFEHEEKVIQRTNDMLAELEDVAAGVRCLADAYRQSYNEQRRLVRLSDRMQFELHRANQNLNEQTENFRALNEKLTGEIEQRKLLEEELRRLATTDSLTGLFNRRYFFELGQREQGRHSRSHGPLSLLVMDLDRFKRVNDSFGHTAGDKVLVSFSRTCRKSVRSIDVIGRMGGEEFAVILPDTALESAQSVAERIRKTAENDLVEYKGEKISYTVSIGVSMFKDEGDTLEQAFIRADQALYEAKNRGRNQIRTII